ncbi:beta-ketoacyl-ACP synthase III [Clostridium sp. AM58-1XD]|uniref:beta-ketoacyl-ACP synthase III n=1 Tax=Clostridium sp. AM58-1XD TaxID=2292307 RepID=UPI000E48CCF6|nr:beta-ketoacyl-ACP synthase III [Clostridium sp. AM58-1XD]RGZ01309.1 ketoacyl-ACP synthase III [Clostridium sp. AM58-1XD]
MTTRILGTGSYAPENVITNDDLAKIMDTSDEWIRSRTGIGARHICKDGGATHMAVEAAKRAVEMAGISPEELDIIIVGTSSPDKCLPSCGCEVQAAIGAVNAVAFDVSAACSGFIFSLNIVHGFFMSGMYRTGLVIGCDELSKLMDWSDRSTSVLFGDGAGAAVVRAEETGIRNFVMGSNGARGHVLECVARTTGNFLTGTKPEYGYTTMDGQEVFKFAVKKVPECISQLLEKSGVDKEEIKYFFLHQANMRIFDSISRRLKIPMDKIPMNIERYGNTSGASLPIILDEVNREGKLERGDKIVIAGFGAGLTWGATLMEW